ncbi:glycosyl hydrolase family 18 protein [Caldalkalibacillus mannanilyticus]|uniref:glycosyl hydrolase family 18 protein n=1 Tax=Caldalkalibacillus mannanilyticus TaxID=1418 RepID=UPI000468B2FB|nr:glycosyl hydrolase family 18 protein [Caldalkalibacillus mannanilyticus]
MQTSMAKATLLRTLKPLILLCMLILAVPEQLGASGKKEKASAEPPFNMSYIYFGNIESQLRAVNRTNDSLHVIAPSFFDIKTDGSLAIKVNSTFVQEMRKKGIKVVPFLSNHWHREAGRIALRNREEMTTQIAKAIEEFGLDGVNVDIENVTDIDREAFTDFVRLLRAKVPKNKEVSVAVAANPNGWTKGWHGSYDYAALAQHSDYLMIMSYDESYEGSAAGPVASIGFVERSIQYALKQGVPADKIVLGVPFFGRYWNDQEERGGRGISLNRVEDLVNRYKGKIEFDLKTQSPKATFTIREQDEKAVVGGRTLTPGSYTLWFENHQSIRSKLFLIQKYNLKGSGSWSLGQENESLWKYYSAWLEGKIFVDSIGHWAEEDIYDIFIQGWMKGHSEHYFAPGESLTRAQAATILSRALELTTTGTEVRYSDVSQQHWAAKEIELVTQYGIMRGMGEGKFGPNVHLTREQLAVILARVFGYQPSEAFLNPFSDLNSTHWAYSEVMAMYEQGVIRGYSDGRFGIQEKVNRAQKAALMNRVSPKISNWNRGQ